MKFLYEYRTSDNAKHSGTICAGSRDAAYAAIKALGVRPSRVVEAPGFFNKLFGKGKRWIAISLLAAVAVVLVCQLHKAEVAVAENVFNPSEQYLSLEQEVKEVIEGATNNVPKARERMKEIFRERYPQLPHVKREREEAQALYGRASFQLDNLEMGGGEDFRKFPLDD